MPLLDAGVLEKSAASVDGCPRAHVRRTHTPVNSGGPLCSPCRTASTVSDAADRLNTTGMATKLLAQAADNGIDDIAGT